MKRKVPYKLGKALTLAGIMALATACHKSYDVVIDWNWDDEMGFAPPKEMVKTETDKKSVEHVFINLIPTSTSTGLGPGAFHRARDTLQTRINIDPNKVRGSGKIYVSEYNSAHMPPIYEPGQGAGMSLEDSIWFTANGWAVEHLKLAQSK